VKHDNPVMQYLRIAIVFIRALGGILNLAAVTFEEQRR
jgi:hypothetical protein